MPDNHNYMGMFAMPKRFIYRSIICECLNINSILMDSMLFKLIPCDDKMTINNIVYAIENDHLFRFQIAMYYQLAVQSVSVKVEIDEVDNKSTIYAFVKTCRCDTILETYVNQIHLFCEDIGRYCNVVTSGCFPFTIHDVKDRIMKDMDPVTVRGFIAYRVSQPIDAENINKMIIPYSVTVNLSITNLKEIRENMPTYTLRGHDELITEKVYDAVKACENAIRAKCSPSGFMKMGFRYLIMSESSMSNDESIVFRVVLLANIFNDYEILDINPYTMTFRLVNGMGKLMERIDSIDWPYIHNAWSQIATSILSDHGTLLIPTVVEHDIVTINDQYYIKSYMNPHVAVFTEEISVYANERIASSGIAREFWWMKSYVNDNVEFIFPTLATLPDEEVLCYFRVPQAFLRSQDGQLNQIASLLCCNEISIRICAETEMYLYMAVIDTTIETSRINPIDCISPDYLGLIQMKNPSTLEDAIETIIGAFSHCVNISGPINSLDEAQRKAIIKECNNSNELAIFALYEDAVQMSKRSWCDTYVKVRDRLLNDAIERCAEAENPQCSDIIVPKHEPKNKPSFYRSLLDKLRGK